MITYLTNGCQTSKSLTEWYFGKKTIANLTATAMRMSEKSGETCFEFFQNGTGILTILIH